MPAALDIVLQRNEDYLKSWRLTAEDGSAIDLTGCTVALQVKDRTNNATVVASANIDIIDAINGEMEVRLTASEGSALGSYGNPLQGANLLYDIRITESDGTKTVLVAGRIVLARGVTTS